MTDKSRSLGRLTLLAVLAGLLAGCGEGLGDPRQYVQQIRAQPPGLGVQRQPVLHALQRDRRQRDLGCRQQLCSREDLPQHALGPLRVRFGMPWRCEDQGEPEFRRRAGREPCGSLGVGIDFNLGWRIRNRPDKNNPAPTASLR